jgi:GT2 family glycosyltransferase
MANPKVSIIVPLYNQAGFTKLCLEYLDKNTPPGMAEIILVDNASSDATGSLLDSLPDAIRRIRNPVNLGFSKACNQGAALASGEYLLFLNNDTVPHAGWLEALLEPFGRVPGLGMVGPKLLFPDGTIQQAGVVFSSIKMPFHLYAGCPGDLPGANRERFFQAVTGACFLVPKADFLAAGRLDERYVNGMEDIHFCTAIRRLGKKVLYNPASRLTHCESRSENRQAAMNANVTLFLRECASFLEQDDFKSVHEDGMDFWIDGNRFFYPTRTEGDAKAKGFLAKAEACVRDGHLDQAERIYVELLRSNPYNPYTLQAIAAVMERLGIPASAATLRNAAAQYSGAPLSP